MTKLDSPVTRQLGIFVDKREVDLTLVPGNEANLEPPVLEFHLKGLKSSVKVPIPFILKALDMRVDGYKKNDERDAFTRLLAGERVSPEEIAKQASNLEALLAGYASRE